MEIDERNFHGHPDYLKLTEDELILHSIKNRDYSFGGDPLGNFHRVAKILENYCGNTALDLSDPTIVCIVYALKQIDAALWMLSNGYEGKTEGIDGRLADAHVYLKIARILRMESEDERDTTAQE